MGWCYEDRRAYGILVNITEYQQLEMFIDNNADVLDCDDRLAFGNNSVFVYIKSTYEIITSDYAFTGYPDFKRVNSKHRCFHITEYDKKSPFLSPKERTALDTSKRF